MNIYKIIRVAVAIPMLLIATQVAAQQVTVWGNDTAYAGTVLTFYTLDNYFSRDEIRTGECTVGADGAFRASFPCRTSQMIHTRPGVFHLQFVAEPNFSYQLQLPPRIDMSPEEKASPFFEPLSMWMNIVSVQDSAGRDLLSDDELNHRIGGFNNYFNPLYDQLAIDAAMGCRASVLDTTISLFRKTLPQTDNGYFDLYTHYCSGMLYYAAQRSGVKYVSDSYFVDFPLQYDNEACMELFNITYDRYFMYFGRSNDSIYHVINDEASFSGLKRLLTSDGVLPGDSLCELVILKNIYDEFYADRFSRQALLMLLDSATRQTQIERHREIAGQLRAKITRLLRGFEPPSFQLFNHDSTLVSLHDYRGKYVYLMFCTTQNYVCLSQYELLQQLYRSHNKWLQIVVVSADESLQNMRQFRQKNGYQWDFLHAGNDPDILKNYDVRIYPTCYLIDPNGKLSLSPAPDASEYLERTLWQELNKKGEWQEYIRKGWIILD